VMRESLHQEQKSYAKAGNAQGRAWSMFQKTREAVVEYVTENPGSLVREVVAGIEHHYGRRQPDKRKRDRAAAAALTKLADAGKLRGIDARKVQGRLLLWPAKGKAR